MKRMFEKHGARALMAALFFVCGLFMTAENAAAQNLTGATTVTVPKQNVAWKLNPDAIDVLKTELINTWRPMFDANPANLDALRHMLYYTDMIERLQVGENVGQALLASLPQAGRLGTDNEVPNTTKPVLQVLYDEAYGLLRQ